jgi:hypothetical protein
MRRGAVQGTKERYSWGPRKEREDGNDWRGGRRLRRRGERETEAALKSWAGRNPASVPPGLVLFRTERDAPGPSALQLPVVLTITLVNRPIFPQPQSCGELECVACTRLHSSGKESSTGRRLIATGAAPSSPHVDPNTFVHQPLAARGWVWCASSPGSVSDQSRRHVAE